MRKHGLQIAFIGAVLGILALGGGMACLFPREMNTYENRYAVQMPELTAEAYGSGTFQDGLESALADQLPKASALKKLYHLGTRGYVYELLSPLSQANPDTYFDYYGVSLTDGCRLVYAPMALEDVRDRLDERIAQIETAVKTVDADFCLYYIEKDTDLNFETGARLGAYEYLASQLDLPMDKFAVETPSDFYRDFYETDHHWNYLGSDRAYVELTKLLDCGEPLQPIRSVTLDKTITGSKAASCGAHQLSEPFCAYRYDFPAMTVTLDGTPAEDYGQQEDFLNGQGGFLSYSAFYGGDNGEAILDTGLDRDNLLILGESYDNAVLKLLATHFGRTHAVDLRYYEALNGQVFDLADYVQTHDIDRVLLMGNIDYFTMNDFALE